MPLSKVKIIKKLKVLGFSEERYTDITLLSFIKDRFEQENRRVLRTDFLIEQIADYSHKSIESISQEMVRERPRRKGVNYTRYTKKARKKKASSSSILQRLASTRTPCKYAVVGNVSVVDATPLRTLRYNPETEWRSPSSLLFTPSGQHATGRRQTLYELHMEGADSALYREVRDDEDICFDEEKLPTLDELNEKYPELFHKPPNFSFRVDKKTILGRMGKGRVRSQRQVTGYSAKEFFEFLGAEIKEKTYGSFYHLAHRHGHALGGAQAEHNLDPATEGSNYHTLFQIESPLRDLLLDDALAVESVDVYGDIEYHPKIPLPQKITYTLTWGNGKSITTSIYPLNYAKPTMADHQMARAFFRSQKTPAANRKAPSYCGSFFQAPEEDDYQLPEPPDSPIFSK